MSELITVENADILAFLGKNAILIILCTIAWVMVVFQFTETTGLINIDKQKITGARINSAITFIIWIVFYLLLPEVSKTLNIDSKTWNFLIDAAFPSLTIIAFIFFTLSLVDIYIEFKKNNNLLTQILFIFILMLPLAITKFYYLSLIQLNSIR